MQKLVLILTKDNVLWTAEHVLEEVQFNVKNTDFIASNTYARIERDGLI